MSTQPEVETLDFRAMARGEEPADVAPAAKTPRKRVVPLHLEYREPETGKLLVADTTMRAIGGKEGRLRDRWCAHAAGNLPWESMPPAAQQRIYTQATVAHSLAPPPKTPDWVFQWLEDDDELARQLFEEVEAHSAEYFRGGVGPGEGGAERPRIRIRAGDAAGAAAGSRPAVGAAGPPRG